ncbi:MAG: ABC transporter permease subunit [Candidatus Hydrogenedentes bacterium]|nr:ABC transporter permease subunit [Candidatus Hydrogenedentota bacterium]
MVPKEVKWGKIRHHWEIYFFILPTLVLIGLFQYYPAASGVLHSFFRWNGADISEFNFVQWDDAAVKSNGSFFKLVFSGEFWRTAQWGGNYKDLVTSSEFWNSFKVAFILGGWNIVKMIPALAVAVCIHRCKGERTQFFYRLMFVIPMVIPGLVVVLIWRSFFFEATSGYLNQFLFSTGLIHVLGYLDQTFGWGGVFAPDPVTGVLAMPAWLGDPRLILTACVIWGFPWVGSFAVLTHLAKLGGIEKQIYESAEIDGVNWWTKFRHIELPLITGSLYILLVFTIIGTIKDAGMVLALAGFEGGPGGKVTVPALFMLRKAFVDQRMGYACAVGIILTLVVMALQKLTNLWIAWDTLKDWQRTVYRVVVLTAAAVLLAARLMTPAAGAFFPLALILIVLGIPRRATVIGALAACAWAYWDSPVARFLAIAGIVAALPYRALFERLGPAVSPAAWLRAAVERRREARLRRRAGGGASIRRPGWREKGAAGLLRFNRHLAIWLVLASAFLPVYLMFIVSVKTNQQFYEAPAVPTAPYQWENWRAAWDSVRPNVANSIFISTSATALTLLFALCGAYFFARLKVPLSGVFWNAILVLMMMPTIANLVPLFRLLGTLNLLNTLTALIMVGASAGQVFAIFVLRNFVADIPQDLFEAAEIDGASHFTQMRTIVLPLSGPILGTVGVMHFITQWNDFVLPLIVMRDHARLPVMVQLLRMAGEYIKLWGPLMAGYALASVPVVVLFVFSMKLFVRGMTEGALKN